MGSMSEQSEKSNYFINIFVILLVVFNIIVLFKFPDPVTGIIVISYTGAFVLIMRFRHMLT